MKSRKINKSRLALAITAGTLGALAQQAVAAGFIEDSKASLTLRNFYINTDNRNGTASPSKQEEWGQGFILNYQSGFTQGTVGFGVDALGLLGVRWTAAAVPARAAWTASRAPCSRWKATASRCTTSPAWA